MKHTVRLVTAAFVLCISASGVPKDFNEWLNWIQPIATRKMLANISRDDTAKGVVIASPSRENPDYFYHWVRDAGLTMDVVVSLYARAEGDPKNFYRQRLLEFVDFSLKNQRTPNLSGGVGEPKFLVNGEPYNGAWGRPQNDSPALRALAFIRWARILLHEGECNLVREKLYTGAWDSVIKADLEFISHHWQDTCFDLWEEIRGHHFFTRIVQRSALLEGADLAQKMGDAGAASWYRQQARLLESEIHKHWNGRLLLSTLNRDGGIDYKHSNLDASIILGVLHGQHHDGFFKYSDERVLATAHQIEETFQNIYPINQKGHRGLAIGRYPEDRYTGYSNGSGNAWFINTNAMAQYYYELSKELMRLDSLCVNDTNRGFLQSLGKRMPIPRALARRELDTLAEWARKRGDDYLSCTQFHMGEGGSMSEQMNRDTGFMQGAHDLTWSYASLLSAGFARH